MVRTVTDSSVSWDTLWEVWLPWHCHAVRKSPRARWGDHRQEMPSWPPAVTAIPAPGSGTWGKETTLDIQPRWGFGCQQPQPPSGCNHMKDSRWELPAELSRHRTKRNINILHPNPINLEAGYAEISNQIKKTWNVNQQPLGYTLNLTYTCTHTTISIKIFWENNRQHNHAAILSISGLEPLWLITSVCKSLRIWKGHPGWLLGPQTTKTGPHFSSHRALKIRRALPIRYRCVHRVARALGKG